MVNNEKVDEGWGFPLRSRKAHYFVKGQSLCNKWLFFGDLEQGIDKSPDNCTRCMMLLKKKKEELE